MINWLTSRLIKQTCLCLYRSATTDIKDILLSRMWLSSWYRSTWTTPSLSWNTKSSEERKKNLSGHDCFPSYQRKQKCWWWQHFEAPRRFHHDDRKKSTIHLVSSKADKTYLKGQRKRFGMLNLHIWFSSTYGVFWSLMYNQSGGQKPRWTTALVPLRKKIMSDRKHCGHNLVQKPLAWV